MKGLYFFLLAFSSAFYILYKGDLSFVLLMFIIILPLAMLAILIVTAVMTDVSAHFEQNSAQRGSPATLKVTVRNRSVFPVTCCIVEIFYKSCIPFDTDNKKRFRLGAALGGQVSETFTFNISAKHCGTADIYVKRILLKDYLEVFSIPVKVSASGKSISLPVIHPIQADIESSSLSTDDSTTFSPHKPGDDPSEIFSLREYREGDNNNRIHWKLSSRSDDFIVKELSNPVGCRILIVTDFLRCTSAAAIDRILDAAFSVSDFLTEHGTAHTFAYARSDYGVNRIEISTPETHLLAENELCNELGNVTMTFSFVQAADSDDFFTSKKHFSRVIAVTDSIDYLRTTELENLFGEAYITVICTGTPDNAEDEECRTEIIYADAEKLSNNELLTI